MRFAILCCMSMVVLLCGCGTAPVAGAPPLVPHSAVLPRPTWTPSYRPVTYHTPAPTWTPGATTLPVASFGFVFTYGLCVPTRVDTFAGTFSRAGTGVDPPVTVPLSLLPEDMQRIQRAMDQIDFFGYPSEFTLRSSRGGTFIVPAPEYTFRVREGARQHTVHFLDNVLNVPSNQATQLRQLADLIERTAHGSPAVAALPALNALCA